MPYRVSIERCGNVKSTLRDCRMTSTYFGSVVSSLFVRVVSHVNYKTGINVKLKDRTKPNAANLKIRVPCLCEFAAILTRQYWCSSLYPPSELPTKNRRIFCP